MPFMYFHFINEPQNYTFMVMKIHTVVFKTSDTIESVPIFRVAVR